MNKIPEITFVSILLINQKVRLVTLVFFIFSLKIR